MTREEIIHLFVEKEAMLEGHFLLTSGRHSNKYMQCAKLFQYPEVSEKICRELAKMFAGMEIDLVVGPAVGGIIMAYEMSRQLKVKNIFAERNSEGVMSLRRGFEVSEGERILVTEDVVTTGGSVREVIELMQSLGAEVVGVGSVVDRSSGKVEFGVPYRAVLDLEVESYVPTECPLCKEGIPAMKLGSRK